MPSEKSLELEMPKRSIIQKSIALGKFLASTPEEQSTEFQRIIDYCNDSVNAFNEVDKSYTKTKDELDTLKHQIEKLNAVLRRAGFQERIKPDTLSSTLSQLLWKLKNVSSPQSMP